MRGGKVSCYARKAKHHCVSTSLIGLVRILADKLAGQDWCQLYLWWTQSISTISTMYINYINYISDGFEAATEEDDPHAKSFLLLLSHETIRSTNRDELYMMRLWAHSIGAFRDPIPSWDSQPIPKKNNFHPLRPQIFSTIENILTSRLPAWYRLCQPGTQRATVLTFHPSPHEWELLGK